MEFIENRSYLLISAKEPMVQWVAEIDGDEPSRIVAEHKSLYFVSPLDNPSPEQVEKLLRKHSAAIFENELFAWYTDRSKWPKERDFETFYKWFNYEYIEEGFDLAPGEISKE